MAVTRSENMARIGSKDTRPEMLLRRALWGSGLRYRIHVKGLPGRPDLVFRKPRLIVFVDGCFWHGCPIHYALPRTPNEYWAEKVRKNVERDRERTLALEAVGWRVFRFWEHEVLRNLEQVIDSIKAGLLDNSTQADRWRVVKVTPMANGMERREMTLLRCPNSIREEVVARVQRHV